MTTESGQRAQLYSVAQVRDLDRRAIEEAGIPGYTLMQRAAVASFRALRDRWPRAHRIAVLCGPGNNGGDGYEIARLARAGRLDATVASVGALPTQGDAARAHAAWVGEGGAVREFHPAQLADADVIVDAIFGIGLTRAVSGASEQAIAAVNARGAAQGVLAVDVPSGLDADTGTVMGKAVRADVSVSFIARKLGLYTGAGPDHAGRREFSDLGVPSSVIRAATALAELQGEPDLRECLPRRARGSHKGTHGHALLVGGDTGMAGAILLAARGALRSGAGRVSVATRAPHALALVGAQPEAMFHGVDHAGQLDELARSADALALGPGLGTGEWGAALFGRALRAGKPLVLDADALNLLARTPSPRLPPGTIITPHPGEAARLLGCDTAEVQRDRLGAARALRERHGAVVVLKGAGSLTVGERVRLCPCGNPGMGVGGSGDVLTGVIVALRVQGLDPESAAATGVLVHALAGDRAALAGERGMIPGDLLDALRTVVNPV